MRKLLAFLLFFPFPLLAQTNSARMLAGTKTITSCPYTILAGDVVYVDVFNSATACAVSIPASGTTGFGAGTVFSVKNDGAGTVTITPVSGTISGAATLALATGQGADIYGSGTGYEAQFGAGSGGGGANYSVQVNNFGLLAGVPGTITNSLLNANNGANPSFNVVGLPLGNSGAPITSCPYTVRPDTATTTVDRATVLEFNSAGACAVTLDDPSTSGMANNFPVKMRNVGAGTVTVSRQTASTFSIVNGSAVTTGATSFTLLTGQYATVYTDNTNWRVDVFSGVAQNVSFSLPNDGSTGTVLNELVSRSATGQAIVTSAGAVSGVVGVCTAGCGTTGNATITILGNSNLLMDGPVAVNDFLVPSSGTTGYGHDAGPGFPANIEVLGAVTSPTGTCASNICTVQLLTPDTSSTNGGNPVAYSVQPSTFWSLAFYTPFGAGGYSVVTDVDFVGMTHIAFVGGTPQADGTIQLTTGFATAATNIVNAAHANGVKVLLVLGSEGNGSYNADGAIVNHLATFVTNTMSLVNTYGFDGVMADFESDWSAAHETTFFASMKTALGSKSLSTTLLQNHAADATAGLVTNLDKIMPMCYVMTGTWDTKSWFNSALYGPSSSVFSVTSADSVVQATIGAGTPASKVLLGVWFSGILATGNGITAPRQASVGTTYTEVTYINILGTYTVTNATYDSQAHQPWLAPGAGWISWENPQSITDKVNYAISTGLGGIGSFALEKDYFPAAATLAQKHPLQNAIKLARIGYEQCLQPINNGIVPAVGGGTGGIQCPQGQAVWLHADFTTAANTNLQVITSDLGNTGLFFDVPPFGQYKTSFKCDLAYSQGTAAAAVAFGIQATPTSPTNVFATGIEQITAGPPATFVTGTLATLSNTTATAIVSGTPGAQGVLYTVHLAGTIENPAYVSGTFSDNRYQIMVSTATSGDAVTVKRGSSCIVGE